VLITVNDASVHVFPFPRLSSSWSFKLTLDAVVTMQ